MCGVLGCHQKTQKHLSRLRDEVVYGEDNTTWYSKQQHSRSSSPYIKTNSKVRTKVMWEVVSQEKPSGTC